MFLLLILVNWIQMTPSSVCFRATGDSSRTFTTPTSGDVITFKLVYQSGYVQCAPGYQSHWGCRHPNVPPEHELGTYITDSQKNRLLPKEEFLAEPESGDCVFRIYYRLIGLNPDSPELLFDNFTIPLHVSAGEQFQIWFAEDLTRCKDHDNSDLGQTCAEVYGLFV